MRFLVIAAIIFAHYDVRVSSLVKRTFAREKLSLKWGHMMARYIPRSELELGNCGQSKTLSQQLSAILFDLSVGKLISHLDGIDKPALEWFDAFISGISADNGDSYESNVMNALTSTDAFLFEYERVSDHNPDVSIKFSHVVEPWVLAALLLNSKNIVFKGAVKITVRDQEEKSILPSQIYSKCRNAGSRIGSASREYRGCRGCLHDVQERIYSMAAV